MLEFWQDGNMIVLTAIDGKGKVGQTVIFGDRTNWGVNPDPTEYPLSQYPCPSIFTIVEKKVGKEGKDRYYVLNDANNNRIKLQGKSYETSVSHLYDAQDWLTLVAMHETNQNSRNREKIERLEDHEALLKDILIKQGIHIVTKTQAEDLGL